MAQTCLSPYQIYWAEFTPTTGSVVTKHDQKKLGELLYLNSNCKYFRKHFANKQAALDYIKNFHEVLDKRYMVRLFTDKQFGMAKAENGYAIPYTKKQLEEVYFVGDTMGQTEKVLVRLIKAIRKGRFDYKRYWKKGQTYYGVEIETDTIYQGGDFGLSVKEDGRCKYWIYKNSTIGCLNINGIEADKVLATL